jgi:hypothetical protein
MVSEGRSASCFWALLNSPFGGRRLCRPLRLGSAGGPERAPEVRAHFQAIAAAAISMFAGIGF